MAYPKLPQNWLAPQDMSNLLEISGFQPLRHWTEVLLPIHIPFISDFSNRYLAKLSPFRFLAMANFMVARPQVAPKKPIQAYR